MKRERFSEIFIDCTFFNIIFLQQMYGTRSPALSLWCAGRGTRWRTDHDRGRGAGTGNGNMTRSDHQLKYTRDLCPGQELDEVAMKNVPMTINYQIMHVMFILLLYKFLTGSALQ